MEPRNLGKIKVMIADDEECNRTMLGLILEMEGWEVSLAQNGREALEKVLKEQPDLLILDYQMPELTGGEVYKKLQSHGIKSPVVLISSYIELEKLASSLGIDYFLHKPFDITELLSIIQSAYENSLS